MAARTILRTVKPNKARRVLLEAGPKLTVERVIAFTEKVLGRKLTPEEIEEAHRMLDDKLRKVST